jgi:hypothetical protein
MPELAIQVAGAEMVPFAVAPTIAFHLQIANAARNETIHTVVLRCQIQIDVTRRTYAPAEQARLRDLFGQPDRWGQTLRNLLWTHASVVVPAFEGSSTSVDLHIPCTFDFNVASTKYFEGLDGGAIPLLMLFSGTVFYASDDNPLQVSPISWDLEARCVLPVQTWRDMMSHYYPNSAWINLHRDAFDRLHQYKIDHGIPTWEQALERLLAEEMVRP